jgi:hypothetical protein
VTEAAVIARTWSIEAFRAFWARPDLTLIPRIREIMTDDIVGYWPRPIGVVRGAEAYLRVIAAIPTVCPDLSLTAPEYAVQSDLHFVRWVASGTGPAGPMTFNGLDRMRLTADGKVSENYVFCDHPFFADVADFLQRGG